MDAYEKINQEAFDQIVEAGPKFLPAYNSVIFSAGKTAGWFVGYFWGALTVFIGAVITYWVMSAN